VNVTMRRANRIAPPPKQRTLVDKASNFMARAETNIARPVRLAPSLPHSSSAAQQMLAC
jgi:hypothetical protein